MEEFLITDEAILEYYGWEIECLSPYEIRNIDGSFASGQATSCVLNSIRQEYIYEKYEEFIQELREVKSKSDLIKEIRKTIEG